MKHQADFSSPRSPQLRGSLSTHALSQPGTISDIQRGKAQRSSLQRRDAQPVSDFLNSNCASRDLIVLLPPPPFLKSLKYYALSIQILNVAKAGD